ncbi:hypothetical protein H4Q26_016532 [Puccinia striiformis f. sp. tritici PST-130]|nr:hypothetical protein H4Q26_016532 [Puccinia striiformis f. sp. tritici PST-130]
MSRLPPGSNNPSRSYGGYRSSNAPSSNNAPGFQVVECPIATGILKLFDSQSSRSREISIRSSKGSLHIHNKTR